MSPVRTFIYSNSIKRAIKSHCIRLRRILRARLRAIWLFKSIYIDIDVYIFIFILFFFFLFFSSSFFLASATCLVRRFTRAIGVTDDTSGVSRQIRTSAGEEWSWINNINDVGQGIENIPAAKRAAAAEYIRRAYLRAGDN